MLIPKIKSTKTKILIVLSLCSGILVCYYGRDIIELYQFGKGVMADTQNRLKKHKALFKLLSFSATIEQKVKCDECSNPYQLVLNLNNKLSADILRTDPILFRYYFFKNEHELHLAVTKEIFDAVSIGTLLIKEPNSLALKVSNTKYQLLSNEPDEWFEN